MSQNFTRLPNDKIISKHAPFVGQFCLTMSCYWTVSNFSDPWIGGEVYSLRVYRDPIRSNNGFITDNEDLLYQTVKPTLSLQWANLVMHFNTLGQFDKRCLIIGKLKIQCPTF